MNQSTKVGKNYRIVFKLVKTVSLNKIKPNVFPV